MPLARHFSDQARLLVAMLPHIARHDCFALKGGTALNFFVRDLPRLSVDIDLVYLPVADRSTSVTAIDQALTQIARDAEWALPGTTINPTILKGTGQRIKLLVTQRRTTVKIEVSDVLRGSVFEPEIREIGPAAQRLAGYARARIVSFEDRYAGKLCAALDRQHPRDLFDMRVLLDNEGITSRLKDAFLVYLMSHDRPMAEILSPNWRDVSELYEREFAGMTEDSVSLETLLATREQMLVQLRQQITAPDRDFLMAVKRGDPDWARFPIPHASSLPAIRWKLHNLSRMPPARRTQALAKLEKALAQ